MKRLKNIAAAVLALSLVAAPPARYCCMQQDIGFGITANAADDWSAMTDEEKVDEVIEIIGSSTPNWSCDEDFLYEYTDDLFMGAFSLLWEVVGSHDEVNLWYNTANGIGWDWLYDDSGSGLSYYWISVGVECGNVYKEVNISVAVKTSRYPEPAYYSVGVSGDYADSGIIVSSYSNAAGASVTVDIPTGYTVDVMSGSNRIASISEGKGSFVMPAGNVTLKVTSYLAALSGGYKNAYIYSYDKDMNHITTNSARGGMKAPEDNVAVKLGSEYAGKSVTLYTGRKSTGSKVDEAVLDGNGSAVFTVKSGKNYTLVVED